MPRSEVKWMLRESNPEPRVQVLMYYESLFSRDKNKYLCRTRNGRYWLHNRENVILTAPLVIMEKIVTKIGDVTIERRVPKSPLQNFQVEGGVLPQNAARNKLEDLSKPYLQSESLRNPRLPPVKPLGLNVPGAGKNFNRRSLMGKSLDSQPEMEQKITLPREISWDYKSAVNSQYRTGNMDQYENRPGMTNPTEFRDDSQSQKRSDAGQLDHMRFSDVSVERKRARIPENEAFDYKERFGYGFFPGKETNFEHFNTDREQMRFNRGDGMFRSDHPQIQRTSLLKGFPIDRLTQGDLTIETVSNNQGNPSGINSYPSSGIQSFQEQPFPYKPSRNHPGETKEVNFEENFENDSEGYDEEDEEEDINAISYLNSESQMDFKPKKPEVERTSFTGKANSLGRSGSPIVLSSEEDDKNDDVLQLIGQSKFENPTPRPDDRNESIVIDDSPEKSASNFPASTLRVKPNFNLFGPRESDKTAKKTYPIQSEITPAKAEFELDSDDMKELQDSSEMENTSSELGEDDVIKISDGGTDHDDANTHKLYEESSAEDDDVKDEKDIGLEAIKAEQEDDDPELKSSETELPASEGSEEGDDKSGKDGEKSDEVDIVCDDLVELMKKGEIEGEVEDEKSDESEEDGEGKKSGSKRKADEDAEGEKKTKSKKKKAEKTEDGDSKEDGDKNIDKSKVTSANLRKNIREVMDETKLDEATLSAQRQEAERLKRLQDQQKIIRDLQKQIVLNKQGQKLQSRMLSLLQRSSQTSILKTSSSATTQSALQSKNSKNVVVKLSNGQQTSLNNKKMIELLKNSKNKLTLSKPSLPKTLLKQGMVSPSVSIAPVAKKEAPVDDKKKKKGDVVTLSSDSEDDCIVLSDDDESEPEEDPTNSGIHTSDKYNVPDEKGRVIVNVGHPESESDIFLAPQIARIIKPHQIGGIRFMYDNVIESVDRFQSSTGFGCILAHSMGLGKTLQIVSFSDIFLRYTSAKTILCIMPINTIQNWLAEFNMWLPKENNSGQEVRCRDFDLYIVNESLKNINARSKVILEWHRNGGVLLMGYELFRLLSLKKSCKSKKKKKKELEEEDEAKNKELMEEVYGALVRPGPDLVICDEGHRIKNSHATTSQALKQIRTKRRIVLTGYPLQNNLLEYWCMVDFVRPNYLGSRTEFSNMFERPIQNGQCIDSTPQDKRLMRYRAHVLHSLLEGFVQRRSHAVLQSTLPEKEEYVLLLRFTPFQRKLYDTFMNEVVRTVAVPNPLKAFAVCCKIWNHPDVLYNFLKKKGEEIDLDLEEALAPPLQPFGQTPPDGVNPFPASPMVPMWPRRGPGSRGGKIRQSAANRRTGRGRKPAATVSPNPIGEKKDQDQEGFSSGSFSSSYPDFMNRLGTQSSNESSMESDRTNRNFGGRGFNQYPSSEYGNHSNFTGSGYDSKNPLENLEDMSSGDFQSKQFYSQQGETGMQNNYSNAPCLQPNYPQNMNQSNNSDINSGFNSNLGRNSATFNNDSSKPFQYNQDYNSEYYPGANYRTPHSNPDFEQSAKTNFNRGNPDSNSYYQNAQYGERDSTVGYNMQSAGNGIDSNYQGFNNRNPDQNYQGNLSKHYHQGSGSKPGYNEPGCNSNPGLNYQSAMMEAQRKGDLMSRSNYDTSPRAGDSNYARSDFPGPGGNFPNSSFNTDRDPNSGSNFQGGNSSFGRSGCQQDYWSGPNWSTCAFDSGKSDGGSEYMRGDKYAFDGGSDKKDVKKFMGDEMEKKPSFGVRVKSDVELDGGYGRFEDDKSAGKMKEEAAPIKKEEEFKPEKKEDFKCPEVSTKKEDGLPYDWAMDLFKNYVTGIIENSSKMEVFFHILTESINLGDRLLVFSQSLLTLDLIEDYLHRRNVPKKEEKWAKNRHYFRLDGSTPGMEREKLINEFNNNPNVFIFLVSTRAGSLGINLVGANRVVVFDASWNPCHDTQAVCRVYRYGQQKPCFVYRLVMDSCLEKKIYDRQINKQGMADRVVDELNPDAHLSIKEVTNLCWDDQEDTVVKDFSYLKDKFNDQIIKVLLENCSKLLSKEPFQHESLLIDRKEKKLSQAEKRLAKRSYELEKQAATQPKNVYSFFPNPGGTRTFGKPIASVRPMQNEMARVPPIQNRSKWIPAEVWQKQGMSAQEMTLPLDVVIPTNTPDKTSIVLKAGQRVMVLKSPKGIYMQLENGKIIAIRTAYKMGQGGAAGAQSKGDEPKKDNSISISSSLKNNPNLTITSKPTNSKVLSQKPSFSRGPDKKLPVNITAARSKQPIEKTKPLLLNRKFQSVAPEIKQRLLSGRAKLEGKDEKASPDAKSSENAAKDGGEAFTPPQEPASEARPPDDASRMPDAQDLSANNKMDTSLETLRKVTENIGDKPEGDDSQVQMNLKNYRHNFSSQSKGKTQDSNDEKVLPGEVNCSKTGEEFAGNENVQNWLMNQSYPPVDPYTNYFPNYYGYGHGPRSVVNPYEGFYPNNYTGQSGTGKDPQTENIKTAPPYQQNRQQANAQHSQSMRSSQPTSSYTPYPNPYQYSYNYPNNPGFNNQNYFPQNQSNQHQHMAMGSGSVSANPPSQNQSYDNSMYSAFHRPDGHFQGPDNSYPVPYRHSYPNNAPPGFLPYNAPYRPYSDPGYHYSSNFNPYMHRSGYGYPVQNPSQINNNNNSAAFNQHSPESAANAS